MLVLLHHHRPDQAHDGDVIGEDADNAGAALLLRRRLRLDRLVEPLVKVGAPQLAPVAGREVAKGQHVIPGCAISSAALGNLPASMAAT